MCLSFDLQRETKGSCNLYTLGLTIKKNQFSVKSLKNVWQNNTGKIAKPWWPSRPRHHYLAELFSQVAVVVWTLLLLKFVIYYSSENFNLCHPNKTNKWQEPIFPILRIFLKCTWARMFIFQLMERDVKIVLLLYCSGYADPT